MDFGNGNEADIDCRQAARRVERQRHQRIIALPSPPVPPFDIETMEPIEVPPHAIWRDDFEEFGPERWTGGEPDWDCHGAIAHANGEATPQVAAKTAHPPELDLGDGRRLVLDAPDPFPEEEWAVSGAN